jgi:antitoxin HicB
MRYAITVEDIGGELMATSRDVPEFATTANELDELLANAVHAMMLALSGYVDDRRPLPEPSKARRGEHVVELPTLAVAKLGLYRAMLAQGVSKAKLARDLGVHPPQVDRLLDVTHGSKIEAIEHALGLLGQRLVVEVCEAA